MTFFITRPPDLTISPRPSTARTPIRLSRAAPAWMRRGPEILAATTPPIVGSPSCRAAGGDPSARRRASPRSASSVRSRRERRTGARREHQFGRLVERHAGQRLRWRGVAVAWTGRPRPSRVPPPPWRASRRAATTDLTMAQACASVVGVWTIIGVHAPSFRGDPQDRARNPEALSGLHAGAGHRASLHPKPAVLGSGLFAARSPGMTGVAHCAKSG